MSRKGLPQAAPAVRWSVTGSLPLPSGTEAALWSVLHSDPPGWEKSAPRHFLHHPAKAEISHSGVRTCSVASVSAGS